MSFYLGMPLTKKTFCSPLRQDHKPSCAFWRSTQGTLYFKDFSTGQCLDFVNVVMVKYNINYYSALERIASDFGITPTFTGQALPVSVSVQQAPVFEEKKRAVIQIEIKPFSQKELDWWSKFGIDEATLKKYNVFSCKTVFLNGEIYLLSSDKCPIYGYYFGKQDNIELWKIYMPLRKSYRWLNNAPKEVAQGYKQLPKMGNILIINKSLKDCMLLHRLGIAAIAPCSETTFIEDGKLSDLKTRFNKIVVMFDNDRAGLSAMVKLRKQHPEFTYVHIPKSYQAKDLSDYYKAYGLDKTKNLIKEGIIHYGKDLYSI